MNFFSSFVTSLFYSSVHSGSNLIRDYFNHTIDLIEESCPNEGFANRGHYQKVRVDIRSQKSILEEGQQ